MHRRPQKTTATVAATCTGSPKFDSRRLDLPLNINWENIQTPQWTWLFLLIMPTSYHKANMSSDWLLHNELSLVKSQQLWHAVSQEIHITKVLPTDLHNCKMMAHYGSIVMAWYEKGFFMEYVQKYFGPAEQLRLQRFLCSQQSHEVTVTVLWSTTAFMLLVNAVSGKVKKKNTTVASWPWYIILNISINTVLVKRLGERVQTFDWTG